MTDHDVYKKLIEESGSELPSEVVRLLCEALRCSELTQPQSEWFTIHWSRCRTSLGWIRNDRIVAGKVPKSEVEREKRARMLEGKDLDAALAGIPKERTRLKQREFLPIHMCMSKLEVDLRELLTLTGSNLVARRALANLEQLAKQIYPYASLPDAQKPISPATVIAASTVLDLMDTDREDVGVSRDAAARFVVRCSESALLPVTVKGVLQELDKLSKLSPDEKARRLNEALMPSNASRRRAWRSAFDTPD